MGSIHNHLLWLLYIWKSYSTVWIKVWPTNAPLFFRHRSGQCPFPKYHFHQVGTLKDRPIKKGVKLVMGRTYDDLCPVTALLSYLIHRGDAPGPLFQLDNHTPLSKSKFVNHIHHALLAANIPVHLYTRHSFHIQAATAVVAALMWKLYLV